jgi:hypothetical protein
MDSYAALTTFGPSDVQDFVDMQKKLGNFPTIAFTMSPTADIEAADAAGPLDFQDISDATDAVRPLGFEDIINAADAVGPLVFQDIFDATDAVEPLGYRDIVYAADAVGPLGYQDVVDAADAVGPLGFQDISNGADTDDVERLSYQNIVDAIDAVEPPKFQDIIDAADAVGPPDLEAFTDLNEEQLTTFPTIPPAMSPAANIHTGDILGPPGFQTVIDMNDDDFTTLLDSIEPAPGIPETGVALPTDLFEGFTGHNASTPLVPFKGAIFTFGPGRGSSRTVVFGKLNEDCSNAPRLPDYKIDLRFLLPEPGAAFDTSCYELAYFFPHCYRWPKVALWLEHWDWKCPNWAAFVSWSRLLRGKRAMKPNSIGHHFRAAHEKLDQVTDKGQNAATFLPSTWAPPRPLRLQKEHPVRDPLLRDLAVGCDITKWPRGSDRRRLTLAVEYALMNPTKALRLSDVNGLSERRYLAAKDEQEVLPDDAFECKQRLETTLKAYVEEVIVPYVSKAGLSKYH